MAVIKYFLLILSACALAHGYDCGTSGLRGIPSLTKIKSEVTLTPPGVRVVQLNIPDGNIHACNKVGKRLVGQEVIACDVTVPLVRYAVEGYNLAVITRTGPIHQSATTYTIYHCA